MPTNLCFLRFKIWQHFMQMRRCFLEFVINHNIWRVKVQDYIDSLHVPATIATSAVLEYSLFRELDSAAFYKSKTILRM